MPLAYFKRYRMEFDLRHTPLPGDSLADGFEFVQWGEEWLEEHAVVKSRSFAGTVDARVFRCLGEISGCRNLMRLITGRVDFLPAGTWLALSRANEFAGAVPCGTIQAVTPTSNVGVIQNVAVLPEFRGFGVGSALIAKSLRGMHEAGMKRAALEVTSQNESALRLYERLGFVRTRTAYKSVKVPKRRPVTA